MADETIVLDTLADSASASVQHTSLAPRELFLGRLAAGAAKAAARRLIHRPGDASRRVSAAA